MVRELAVPRFGLVAANATDGDRSINASKVEIKETIPVRLSNLILSLSHLIMLAIS
jgi:hypothetical protein